MISPTVGRIVWVTTGAHETVMTSDQPMAAIITYVHSDSSVNLAVFGKGGDQWRLASVKLLADGEDVPARGNYAEWMPFQKGQAAKYDAAMADKTPGAAGSMGDEYRKSVTEMNPASLHVQSNAGVASRVDGSEYTGDAPTGFELGAKADSPANPDKPLD